MAQNVSKRAFKLQEVTKEEVRHEIINLNGSNANINI